MAVHRFTVSWVHERELDDGQASIEVGGVWRVQDACAVVAHRLTDVPRLCRLRLQHALTGSLDTAHSVPALEAVLRQAMPQRLDLIEGVSLGDLHLRVIRTAPDHEVVRHLLADHDEADLQAAWRQDRDLAEAGMRAVTDADDTSDVEREATIIAALRRLADLNSRIADHVPPETTDIDRPDGRAG
jgi:hypothetical protein